MAAKLILSSIRGAADTSRESCRCLWVVSSRTLSNPSHLKSSFAIFEVAHMINTVICLRMRSADGAHVMESESSNDNKFVTVKSCEYKALKECLDRNRGKKEKCEKEWREFENLCTKNRQ